jgi:hypothetical protein
MTKNLVFFFAALTLAGCKFDNQNEQGEQVALHASAHLAQGEPAADAADTDTGMAQQHEYVDSFKIEMDSLMDAKIKLPPVYYHEVQMADEAAAEKFAQLSKVGNGKMKVLVNSSLVAKEITHTINAVSVPQSDLLILIDKTYSMSDDIANVRSGIEQIIDTIKKYKGTRLAVAFYGDKNADGMEWYSFRNFETDYEGARRYIADMKLSGGGDIPESVYEGVMKSFEYDFWRSKKKCNIILVGDAPPLEKPYSDYTIADVMQKARSSKTIMNFYPIIIMPEVTAVKLPPSEVQKYHEKTLVTSLYPNPSRGQITVGFEENGSYYMELYNAAGEMILSEQFYGLSWSRDLDNTMSNGMYILRIIAEDHRFELKRFILQR